MVPDPPGIAALLEDVRPLLEEDEILSWSDMESDSTVIRAELASGRSIIIKRVTDTGFDQPDHDGSPQRFLNEWAGLAFLGDLGADDVAPELITAHLDSGLLILEDLGEHDNLELALLAEDPGRARRGLVEMAEVLARLHACGYRQEELFRRTQKRLRTGSPMSDTTMDQRERRDLFRSCFASAGVDMTERIWRSIGTVEGLVHDDSPFRSLVHGDAGPHNVLLTDYGARLIDFEFCVFRNGLVDVAGARLGFPQTAAAMGLPHDDMSEFEVSYRRALAFVVSEIEDDALFLESLGATCAHWALNRLAGAWRLHVEPRIEKVDELSVREADRLARTFLVVRGFVDLARDRSLFEELADAIDRCTQLWLQLWPEIGSVPVYPALRNSG